VGIESENGQFERLIERHYGMVHAIAYGRFRQREIAEDLAQEVFLRAFLYRDRMSAPDDIAGWLVRVAHNLATDWQRRGVRASKLVRMVPIEDVHEQIADESQADPRVTMPQREQERIVHDAVLALPAGLREVVLLRYSEGLSQKEIAQRLGVHPSTIGRQLKQALRSMRGCADRVLREAGRSLRPPREAIMRTIVLTAAVAALGAEAKAALAEAAGGVAWPASLAPAFPAPLGLSSLHVSGVFPILSAGGKLMLSGKGITSIVAVFALAGTGVVLHNGSVGARTTSRLPGSYAPMRVQEARIASRPAAVPGGVLVPATRTGPAVTAMAAAPTPAATTAVLVGKRVYCVVCGKLLEDAISIRVPTAEQDKYVDDGINDNGIANDGVRGNVLVVRDKYIGPECDAIKNRLISAVAGTEYSFPTGHFGHHVVAPDSAARIATVPALLELERQRDGLERDWQQRFLAPYRIDANDPRSEYYPVYVADAPRTPQYPVPAGYQSPQQMAAAAKRSASAMVPVAAKRPAAVPGVAMAGAGAVAAVRKGKR
jgi:RNA polymerase sigma factor (sigma-70 family)